MRAALMAMSLAIACSDPNVPADVACAEILEVAELGLAGALAMATSGDCVLLPEGSFDGPVVLPPGVSLVAEVGATPELAGGVPAVVSAGEGSAMYGVSIASGPAHGILIEAASFTAARTQVFDVVDAAVGIRCEDPGCLRGEIAFDELEIRRAGSGLVVLGANTIVRGGVIAEVTSTSLSGGGAIYVANGGVLDADGMEIATSDYGLVADASVVSLRGATVRDCAAAGIWAQDLGGTAPALTIEGTAIFGHAGIGVGLLGSSGVSIADASISGTTLRSTVLPDGSNGEIGDGLLVLAGSAQISVASTTLRSNARAQAIVDMAGAGVVFGANTVDATGGEWEVVVQNGGVPVTVPAQDLSTAPILPVPLMRVVVPSVSP